ncbi:MAG: ABC transporter substrate-binding protein [Bryobacteraceae bacterium]
MNRRIFLPGLAGLAGCARGAHPRLNVFNWSDYVAPETIPGFEREFGVQVRYSTYESNEEMLAKVMTGNSGWDVVFPSNYLIEPMRALNLLEPLRHEWLPRLANLEPRYQSPPWDPRLQWSVPFMVGSSGIVSRERVTSWSGLWDPRFAGRITMLDDPAEVLGACLKKLGYSINSTDPRQLDRARAEAVAQKKLLRAYLNAEVRDHLVAGDVLAAQLWATTSQLAIDAQPALRFTYPAEGFALYCDTAAILRESRRAQLAHRFLDYLLRPDVASAIVRAKRTTTANAEALRLLPASIRSSATQYPGPDVLARGEWFAPMPAPAQRLRDRIWTEIKSS